MSNPMNIDNKGVPHEGDPSRKVVALDLPAAGAAATPGAAAAADTAGPLLPSAVPEAAAAAAAAAAPTLPPATAPGADAANAQGVMIEVLNLLMPKVKIALFVSKRRAYAAGITQGVIPPAFTYGDQLGRTFFLHLSLELATKQLIYGLVDVGYKLSDGRVVRLTLPQLLEALRTPDALHIVRFLPLSFIRLSHTDSFLAWVHVSQLRLEPTATILSLYDNTPGPLESIFRGTALSRGDALDMANNWYTEARAAYEEMRSAAPGDKHNLPTAGQRLRATLGPVTATLARGMYLFHGAPRSPGTVLAQGAVEEGERECDLPLPLDDVMLFTEHTMYPLSDQAEAGKEGNEEAEIATLAAEEQAAEERLLQTLKEQEAEEDAEGLRTVQILLDTLPPEMAPYRDFLAGSRPARPAAQEEEKVHLRKVPVDFMIKATLLAVGPLLTACEESPQAIMDEFGEVYSDHVGVTVRRPLTAAELPFAVDVLTTLIGTAVETTCRNDTVTAAVEQGFIGAAAIVSEEGRRDYAVQCVERIQNTSVDAAVAEGKGQESDFVRFVPR